MAGDTLEVRSIKGALIDSVETKLGGNLSSTLSPNGKLVAVCGGMVGDVKVGPAVLQCSSAPVLRCSGAPVLQRSGGGAEAHTLDPKTTL